MTEPKKHGAKVGSQPWVIVYKGASKPKVGRLIMFRRSDDAFRWTLGRVTKINPDGMPFISLE